MDTINWPLEDEEYAEIPRWVYHPYGYRRRQAATGARLCQASDLPFSPTFANDLLSTRGRGTVIPGQWSVRVGGPPAGAAGLIQSHSYIKRSITEINKNTVISTSKPVAKRWNKGRNYTIDKGSLDNCTKTVRMRLGPCKPRSNTTKEPKT